MTGLKMSGAAAVLAAAFATQAAGQAVVQNLDPYAATAAARIPGAIVVPAPRDSYAAYTGQSADETYAYYGDRPVSRRTPCGLQSGATYMGPDGRWYPC